MHLEKSEKVRERPNSEDCCARLAHFHGSTQWRASHIYKVCHLLTSLLNSFRLGKIPTPKSGIKWLTKRTMMDFKDGADTALACNKNGDIVFASIHNERLDWNVGYVPYNSNKICLLSLEDEEEIEVQEDSFILPITSVSGIPERVKSARSIKSLRKSSSSKERRANF